MLYVLEELSFEKIGKANKHQYKEQRINAYFLAFQSCRFAHIVKEIGDVIGDLIKLRNALFARPFLHFKPITFSFLTDRSLNALEREKHVRHAHVRINLIVDA